MSDHLGRYSRGYLPHIDVDSLIQFITWRSIGSVPADLIARWEDELGHLPDDDRFRQIHSRVEAFCDGTLGDAPMRSPAAARACHEVLLRGHGGDFDLIAWVVMPNHVHVLLRQRSARLGDLVRRLKASSALAVNRARGVKGTLWQRDYFDRWIRDDDHLGRVRSYIEWNPVKARLCTDPKTYAWSSANPDAWSRLEALSRNQVAD